MIGKTHCNSMKRPAIALAVFFCTGLHLFAQAKFKKHVIDPDFPTISARVIDVDGDGVLDVVAAGGPSGWHSQWAYRVNWYKGPGWEQKPVCELNTNAVILHLEAVDFTNRASPGKAQSSSPEIVLTEGIFGDIWWYRYDREARQWKGVVIVSDIKFAHGSAAGDIDRDGFMDVLVPTQRTNPRHGMVWARNPGTPEARAKEWRTYPLAESFSMPGAHYVRLADINGDGRLDAMHAASCGKGWFGYWLQGQDPFTYWEQHALSGTVTNATNLDAADMNGDGKTDLVGTEGHGVGVWCFPAPEFNPVRVDDTLKSTHCLALADFTGDGHTDIVTCGYESRKLACFVNDGKGAFKMTFIDGDQCAYDACAVDMDKDGDMDILLSGQNSGNLVWYENLGSGSRVRSR